MRPTGIPAPPVNLAWPSRQQGLARVTPPPVCTRRPHASSPVLVLTGQVDSVWYGKGKGYLHEHERQLDTLGAVARRVESVRFANEIADVVALVATDILTGRPQPGAVEIPIDFQGATVDVDIPDVSQPQRLAIDETLAQRAANMLCGAARPLIWAGGGVVRAEAWAELTALAEMLDAPVITSANGRGSIAEDHPNSIGPSPDRMGDLIARAETVLAAGARFQANTTRNWELPLPTQLIHLDADAAMIGRNYPAEIAIVADAKVGLGRIGELVKDPSTDPGWLSEARAARVKNLEELRTQMGPGHAVVMDTIRELMPADSAIVRDCTVPAYVWANRALPVVEPRTSIQPMSGAIGPGLPLAIGAAIGRRTPTILIQGDGGLMLSVGELAAAAQYALPLVMCVFNDRGYGVLRQLQDILHDGRRTQVDLATPDFAALAASMGIPSAHVDSPDGFGPALEAALARTGPTVLDIDMAGLGPIEMWPGGRR